MRIGYVKISELPRLSRLFRSALVDDFRYFPRAAFEQARRDNSLPRLAASWLKPGRILAVAVEGRNVVGYSIASAEDPLRSQLYWLYVRPSHRGQGVSGQLLDFTHRQMRAQGSLLVQLVTRDFADYYAQRGYKLAGQYQINGVDMHLMELALR
ncbi:MAG TPA: GNAT family N-acetyltransferase [Candidatus Saccharimonadales bacterium]|nr:GNAT family N-acetyltransferase [Candidatus Saccharimonadales bacterium]